MAGSKRKRSLSKRATADPTLKDSDSENVDPAAATNGSGQPNAGKRLRSDAAATIKHTTSIDSLNGTANKAATATTPAAAPAVSHTPYVIINVTLNQRRHVSPKPADDAARMSDDDEDEEDEDAPTSLVDTNNTDLLDVLIRPSYLHSTNNQFLHLPAFNVYMSPLCAALRLKISPCNRVVTGEKGYRSVKATHGIAEGCWYWEAQILQPTKPTTLPPSAASHIEPQVRVGWSTDKADINAPVGYDRHGYCYNGANGEKFHEAYGQQYGDSYTVGDVIGCYMNLPTLHEYLLTAKNFDLKEYDQQVLLASQPEQFDTSSASLYPRKPNRKKKRAAAKKKKADDEDEEDQKPTLTPAEVEIYRQRSETFVLGSQIIFYKNGQPQGVAYTDLLRSTYMPTISLYMGAAVEVNFGPYYAIPPPDLLQSDLSHCGLYPLYSDSHTTIKKNPVIPADKIGIQPVDDGKPKRQRQRDA